MEVLILLVKTASLTGLRPLEKSHSTSKWMCFFYGVKASEPTTGLYDNFIFNTMSKAKLLLLHPSADCELFKKNQSV